MDYEEIKQRATYEVCQHYYPRKKFWCGREAEYVLNDGSGACAEHAGLIALGHMDPDGWADRKAVIFPAHVWYEFRMMYGDRLRVRVEVEPDN